MTDSERLATVEANIKTIFHQLDEHSETLKDLTRLTIATEKLADGMTKMSDDLSDIKVRISNVEKEPAKKYNRIKDKIIDTVISIVVGALLGAVLALIIK